MAAERKKIHTPAKNYSFFRDMKLRYKLLFIFSVLLVLIVNAFFFAWSTAQDSARQFKSIQDYALPSLVAVSSIKDNLHIAVLAVYEFSSTQDPQTKVSYQTAIRQTVAAEIDFFKTSQTEQDFTFIAAFNNHINDVNSASEHVITVVEEKRSPEVVAQSLDDLSTQREEFTQFLEEEVTGKIQQQVIQLSTDIQHTANQIQLYLYLALAIAVCIVVFLLYFLANYITKPIEALTLAAKQFGEGTFIPVSLHRRDELGLFAETFNTMGHDILQAKQALEIELEKTKELDRNKTEFISVAAHQLRTPMSGIKWVMSMAAEGDLGEVSDELKHHLKNGVENADRMIKVINGLLDLSQLEEAKSQFKKEPKDIQLLIQEIMEALSANAAHKKVRIKLSLPKRKLPQIRVDAEKIKVAIHNLIDNAIKYSPEEKAVTIGAAVVGSDMQITVSDQGYGIPQDQQHRVFEKFFRGKNIVKVETEGSGLGLTIVKEIVDKHDGKIFFVSEEGKGTTFTIALPLK